MTRVALLLIVVALPAAAEEPAPKSVEPRPVVSEIVDLTGELAISFVGTVSAKVEVDLGFPMIGTIAERPVSRGDMVTKGEVLAQLDPEDLDASLRAAEAAVTVARAQANSARDVRDRAQELAIRGAGSQTRLDDAQRALVAADARLEQAQAAQARAADMRELATLTAPQDGVVTAVYEDPGATLAAGQPVLQLSGTQEREIVIDLSEKDAAALTPGAQFVTRLIANSDVTARATLDRIDPVAERTTRTRRAHLLLDAPPAAFRLGALAHVAPATASGAAIVLPRTAILGIDSAPAVWVVNRADNTVQRTPVTLGLRHEDFAVVAGGLTAGDEIVTRGIHSLEDGQAVGPRVAE